ncbi:MAG: 50S ribosomal protein L10 [Gammaproteobacteria bacterium CG11_big_fil_rev_8_21_14_0_20_46_22]|nr:MAG: 50S ribosomal protein L10 [Gammaproteobacteria bacterium CG12_big_fil_rev_8_21_14_0_65_46_12]PIR11594.1 MAG: 50S ribosomal protein L10 [Gammaproteobacteria bacterium CG11_big_fil_rev_8_21_14_0_20_46_22]
MALRIDDKKQIVAEVSEQASQACAAVAANYQGLTVSEMTELRAKARDAGVYLRVVRNTLARRAFKDTQFECMNEALVGPLVLGFSFEEPGAAARLFRDFGKDHEALEVAALSLDGQLLAASQLKAVASLPTRDEAIAQLMSVMKAPVSKFVRTMAEPTAKFVRTVKAVADSKAA